MDIILGTGSLMRLQAMERLRLPFHVEISDFDEEQTKSEDIDSLVIETAKGKADVLASRFPDSLIITADSNHLFEGKIYGKPKDLHEARAWLWEMRGKTQEIHTGLVLTLPSAQKQTIDLNVSRFTLKNFTQEALEQYLVEGAPLKRAGAVTPVGPGLLILESFEGEPGADLALPLDTLRKRLREFGVEI